MGILLIGTGILLLISELQGFNGAGMILRWWPVILIVLGLEILAHIMLSHEEQSKIKFDGLSIFLTIFIILVCTGVYGIGSFFHSDFSQSILGEIGYYKNESIVNQKYDFNPAEVEKMQISNVKGNISVESYEGETIKVDTSIIIRNNDEEKALKLVQDLIEVSEGKTLTLHTRDNGILQDSRNYQVSVNYSVKVPKEIEYIIKNRFGEIRLDNLAGDVKIDGEYGSIKTDGIQGNVLVENSFGETRLIDIVGTVEATSEYGEIIYSNKQATAKEIVLSSKMADIILELNSAQQGSFDVSTEYGEITMDGFSPELPVNSDDIKQELKGTIGKGSPQINLKAEHGNIFIKGY